MLFLGCRCVQAEVASGANRETTSETILDWVRGLYSYWRTEYVKTKGAVLLGLVINGRVYEKEFDPATFGVYDLTWVEVLSIRDSFVDRTCDIGPRGNLPQFRGLVSQDPRWETVEVRYSLPSGEIKTEKINVQRDSIAKQALVLQLFELLVSQGLFQ